MNQHRISTIFGADRSCLPAGRASGKDRATPLLLALSDEEAQQVCVTSGIVNRTMRMLNGS